MPLLFSLQRRYIWSDGCSAQFRSSFTFVLLTTHLHPDKDIEWNYNEAHHGKGPTDLHPDKDIEWNYSEAHHGKGPICGIGGTIKNKVFEQVKSVRIFEDSPKDFAVHASRLIQSITTLYLPKKNIF